MAIVGGLSAQVGISEEVTFGTIVTPDRFHEFNSESLKQSIERIESQGLRPNRRVHATDDWVAGRVGIEGDLEIEVVNKGLGRLFKHCLGAIATSQPAVGPSPLVYEHKATLGALDGKSLTVQVGRTGTDGTTRAFTYAGCKVSSWEFDIEANGLLMLKLGIDGASEATATGLASATYGTNLVPLAYTGGAITVGGTATPVKKFNIKGENSLSNERYLISATTPAQKREQLEGDDLRDLTGQLDAEFNDLVAYNRFVNGTIGNLVATFEGGVIQNAYKFAVVITLAAVRFDGETPNIDGPGIPEQSLPFKALDDGTSDSPISVVYRTSDTLP